MTREEFETKIVNMWEMNLAFVEEARLNLEITTEYIKFLEEHITELETPKTCEGCEYVYYPNRFNALKTCKECYRSGMTDYYTLKETK